MQQLRTVVLGSGPIDSGKNHPVCLGTACVRGPRLFCLTVMHWRAHVQYGHVVPGNFCLTSHYHSVYVPFSTVRAGNDQSSVRSLPPFPHAASVPGMDWEQAFVAAGPHVVQEEEGM